MLVVERAADVELVVVVAPRPRRSARPGREGGAGEDRRSPVPQPSRSSSATSIGRHPQAGVVVGALDPRHATCRQLERGGDVDHEQPGGELHGRVLRVPTSSPARRRDGAGPLATRSRRDRVSARASAMSGSSAPAEPATDVLGRAPRRAGRPRSRRRRRRPGRRGWPAPIGPGSGSDRPTSSKPQVSETMSSSWWASSTTTRSCSGRTAPSVARSSPSRWRLTTTTSASPPWPPGGFGEARVAARALAGAGALLGRHADRGPGLVRRLDGQLGPVAGRVVGGPELERGAARWARPDRPGRRGPAARRRRSRRAAAGTRSWTGP